jgi:hypothetical protein
LRADERFFAAKRNCAQGGRFRASHTVALDNFHKKDLSA